MRHRRADHIAQVLAPLVITISTLVRLELGWTLGRYLQCLWGWATGDLGWSDGCGQLSRTLHLTRALANDLDPRAWPCCGRLNLRLWSSLMMLEPCSRDFMDQNTVWAMYEPGYQSRQRWNLNDHDPMTRPSKANQSVSPLHFCPSFVQQFGFRVRRLENAEPIAMQCIYCSPSSTLSGLKFWWAQESKIYWNLRVEAGKCKPQGFRSFLKCIQIPIHQIPPSSPSFFFNSSLSDASWKFPGLNLSSSPPLLEFKTPAFFFLTSPAFCSPLSPLSENSRLLESALPHWKVPQVRIVVSEFLRWIKLTVIGWLLGRTVKGVWSRLCSQEDLKLGYSFYHPSCGAAGFLLSSLATWSTFGWLALPWQVGGSNPEISRRNLGEMDWACWWCHSEVKAPRFSSSHLEYHYQSLPSFSR